jgi:hypothetical protein
MATKSTGKNTANLKPPFKKGESGNPNGRPKGQRNFATLYREAILKIATSTKQQPDAFELEIVEQAVRKARNGDVRFYQDLMDRLHGKAPQHIDHTTDGKALPQPIINVFRNDGIQKDQQPT